ncbi:hypothetical protein [Actinomadura keratinilytica]|uniref:hypothetical protein n=1 Tax=Actinomadura keratinilytica TaxID=547461 RepID=UPI00360D1733
MSTSTDPLAHPAAGIGPAAGDENLKKNKKGKKKAKKNKEDHASEQRSPAAPRPGMRGFAGRGGGRAGYVEAPPEWRGTTVQVCGLWPFGAGSGTPMVGVPLGRELMGGTTLCCDPISWFQRAGLIHNPSVLVLGKPGLGKSTLIRRMVVGLTGYGVFPMVLGDLKPDYVDLIRALGGQIIKLGRGLGSLNVLDPGRRPPPRPSCPATRAPSWRPTRTAGG